MGRGKSSTPVYSTCIFITSCDYQTCHETAQKVENQFPLGNFEMINISLVFTDHECPSLAFKLFH